MSIFTQDGESCEKMSFDEFQTRVMAAVREKNYMGLVESWDKHIIFKEFRQGQHNNFYATVYYADRTFEDKAFSITIYNFSYYDIRGSYPFTVLMAH